MGLVTGIASAFLYAGVCLAALFLVPAIQLSPGVFMVLFFVSMVIGGFLIVLQTDNDTGDPGNSRPITLLSGQVIPPYQESPERARQDAEIQSWVSNGKVVFFFLSLFLLVFWCKLSWHGLPKEWLDKGYSLLLFMFVGGSMGADYTNGRYASMLFELRYLYFPVLISIPYTYFIYHVLHGRRMFSEITDNDD